MLFILQQLLFKPQLLLGHVMSGPMPWWQTSLFTAICVAILEAALSFFVNNLLRRSAAPGALAQVQDLPTLGTRDPQVAEANPLGVY